MPDEKTFNYEAVAKDLLKNLVDAVAWLDRLADKGIVNKHSVYLKSYKATIEMAKHSFETK